MSLTNILLIVIIVLLLVNLLLLLFQVVATFTMPERLMEFLLDVLEGGMDMAGDQVVEVEVTPLEVEEPEKPKKGFSQSKTASRSKRFKSTKARTWQAVTKEEAE
jgi:hypothetical protein